MYRGTDRVDGRRIPGGKRSIARRYGECQKTVAYGKGNVHTGDHDIEKRFLDSDGWDDADRGPHDLEALFRHRQLPSRISSGGRSVLVVDLRVRVLLAGFILLRVLQSAGLIPV